MITPKPSIIDESTTTYYFQLNSVLTKLSKPTARWIMTYYCHNHTRGKRMYKSRNASSDKYTYTFCDILYDVKYRTECIVLKETKCYVTVAVLHNLSQTKSATVCKDDFFTRRRWKSNELKRSKHVLATMQELSTYVNDLNTLFKNLKLESVN
jgi:hypothetical protein